jgi:hypothetical protein
MKSLLAPYMLMIELGSYNDNLEVRKYVHLLVVAKIGGTNACNIHDFF